VYQYTSSWAQIGQDLNGRAEEDEFGSGLSLSSDGAILAVGATGGFDVRVFEYNSSAWLQVGDDIENENNGRFGNDVSLSSDGTIIAIGAYYSWGREGAMYVYQCINGAWTQVGDVFRSRPESSGNIEFGHSVALSSDGLVVAGGAKFGSYVQAFSRPCATRCITDVSSPIIEKDSTPSLTFVGALASLTSYIGVASKTGGCGSPSAVFQYATVPTPIAAVGTVGTYVLCYSYDGGSIYHEQTIFGDAFVVSEHFCTRPSSVTTTEYATITEDQLDLSAGSFSVTLACESGYTSMSTPTAVACTTTGDYSVTDPCTSTCTPCRTETNTDMMRINYIANVPSMIQP
jgi:hypothetical protein